MSRKATDDQMSHFRYYLFNTPSLSISYPFPLSIVLERPVICSNRSFLLDYLANAGFLTKDV